MSGAPGRRRPPAVVVGWVAVLALAVGLGIAGRTHVETPRPASQPPVPSAVPSSVATRLVPPGRPPTRPAATRPPIGEDGIMGGIVFDNAWDWMVPASPP